MNSIKTHLHLFSKRHAGKALTAAALTALLVEPALATDLGTNQAMQGLFDTINGITPGIKAVVAVIGFLVALISLVALRSFSAVLFFLGMAVFGAGGLAVAQSLLGATMSLI